MLAHDSYRCHEPVSLCSDLPLTVSLVAAPFLVAALRDLLVFFVPFDAFLISVCLTSDRDPVPA